MSMLSVASNRQKKFQNYAIEEIVFDPDTIIPMENEKLQDSKCYKQRLAMEELTVNELAMVFALR